MKLLQRLIATKFAAKYQGQKLISISATAAMALVAVGCGVQTDEADAKEAEPKAAVVASVDADPKEVEAVAEGVDAAALAVVADAPEAQPENDDFGSDVKAKISAALSKNAGAPIPVLGVKKTPSDDLLEVTIPGGILYTTTDGSFFVAGDMYQVSAAGIENLSELDRVAQRKSLLDNIDINNAIVFSPEGEVKSYVWAFTDVNCGYCRKLHQEVAALNKMGIEVRYLAFPRGGMTGRDGKPNPNAVALTTAWCSNDQKETLTKLKNGTDLPNITCDSPVEDQFNLGLQLGVNGTPSIFTADGQNIPGYRRAKELAAILGVEAS